MLASIPITASFALVKVWITCDHTGIHFWNKYPMYDNANQMFYGGDALQLPTPPNADLSQVYCARIDVPVQCASPCLTLKRDAALS